MTDLRKLRQQLKNARRRAVYWSGRPSFCGFGFRPGVRSRASSGHPDLQYEICLDDIGALCDEIERLTGRRPKETNPRQEYRKRMAGFLSRGKA